MDKDGYVNNGFHPDLTGQLKINANDGEGRGEGAPESPGGWKDVIRKEIQDKRPSPSGRSLVKEDIFESDKRIGVLGNGDFGRALAGRLAQAGYSPVIGSRNPDKFSSLTPAGVELSSYEVACKSDILVVAIPQPYYHTLPAELLKGKILIDCSNRSTVKRQSVQSQAEYLAELYPDSTVVKGFNVLSAYALENGGLQGSKQVFIAGDSIAAKSRVSDIIRGCGFTPVDLGALTAARTIEDIPVSVFPSWRLPFLIHLLIFIFFYAWSFAKFQICWPLTWSDSFLWELWNHIPMDNVNKTLAVHALNTLALCYLPGVIAGWIQIVRGTKYSRFPNWLDKWLKMRKQLGLLMLFSASIHACLSLAYMSPAYQDTLWGSPAEVLVDKVSKDWTTGETVIYTNQSIKVMSAEKMDWQGECFLMAGVFGFFLVVLLGISSLPGVTQTLSWKEFAYIQSGLGWISMLFLMAHDMFYGWKYINGPSCYIPSSFQYALYVPGLTVLLKAPLVIPPISWHLDKIRGGYERGYKTKVDSSSVTLTKATLPTPEVA